MGGKRLLVRVTNQVPTRAAAAAAIATIVSGQAQNFGVFLSKHPVPAQQSYHRRNNSLVFLIKTEAAAAAALYITSASPGKDDGKRRGSQVSGRG